MEQSITGMIIKGVGGLYTVLTDADAPHVPAQRIACRAKGAFRHAHMTPLAGDRVLLCGDGSAEGGYVIQEILPRKNALIRPPLANLELMFVTMAAASPTPILPTVDKMICIAEHHGIEPVVVITKADLDREGAERIADIYRKAGFVTFVLDSIHGTGIDALYAYLETDAVGKIAAFAGASGIGKSTLMNKLFPTLELDTSEISRKTERGRHTTRHVELYALPFGGFLADTPGFSLLDFERFDFFSLEDLPLTVREFAPYLGSCRYTKCSHTTEQGCAIVEAVKNGEIAKSRHESFVELYHTLKAKKKW